MKTNIEVVLQKDRPCLKNNDLSTIVNSQEFTDMVNTKWQKCVSTPVNKAWVIYEILFDVFIDCKKKAKEYVNANQDSYYLLYNNDGTVNVNSIWWEVITDSKCDVRRSKELLLPFNHKIGTNSEKSNNKTKFHISKRTYSTYHICCDSHMYGLLDFVSELKINDTRGVDIKSANQEMIRCYMMLAAVDIINYKTPPCLDNKPEWKCLFENHKTTIIHLLL